MSFFRAMMFLKFMMANGDAITEQWDFLVAFVTDLRDRFAATGNNPATLSVMDDAAFESLASAHPQVAAACQAMQAAEPSISAIGPRGVFKDLFKDIIEDPQKYIDLFLLFKNLFGLKVPNATTPATPATPPTV